jgi:pyrophosphatase PpaX
VTDRSVRDGVTGRRVVDARGLRARVSVWSAVLFDLDGTLADTVGLILDCYRHTMRHHLGAERPDAEWIERLGMPLRDQLRLFARSEEEARSMLETYVVYQRTVHDEMACAFPGAAGLLAALAARDVPVGLVTSKGREMGERTLVACDFPPCFGATIFADDVARGKPDPEPVLLALERLGVSESEDALFVGDSPHDVEAGRRAGVSTAAVLWGPFDRAVLEASKPDNIVETFDELRTLLLPR